MVKPTICNSDSKTPSIPEFCDDGLWEVPVNSLSEIKKADRDHAYILPGDSVWVLSHDGKKFIQINLGGGSGSAYELPVATKEVLGGVKEGKNVTILEDGTLSVETIKGEKGDKGDTGEKGDKGDTGEKGEKGDKGETIENKNRGDQYFPKFIAHRGNNLNYPENSRLAFKTVSNHWGIETDIQMTTDGQWYCFHDSTLDRMTNGTGKFMEKSSSEIENIRLKAGNGIVGLPDGLKKIPTFEEYLDDCLTARKIPVIEITPLKSNFTDSQLDSIVDTIKRRGIENNCVIICFTLDVLIKIRGKLPNTTLQYLIYDDSEEVMKKCKEFNLIPSIASDSKTVSQEMVFKYHRENLHIGIWVSKTNQDNENYTTMGFDFITVDTISGSLRYEELNLMNGFLNNNEMLSGKSFVEEISTGVIHLRLNVKDGDNAVRTKIAKLPDWAIPKYWNTLSANARTTKIDKHTFIPVSVDLFGYSALTSTTEASLFGYITTGTNWEYRSTYATLDFIYTI